ncbi:MAG TPA: ParB/RepB/Spo0J family partition protein [Dehalococcoidia bacterium]|jgi:ParB family chromosome partitioning protein|nr:ParB/RepB/Spo0J family partition protein [Dehalococcoidia bacterium]
MTNRHGLGRGLDALIPSRQPVVEQVDIDLIAPNPHQPRTVFDAEALTELADSIKEHGIIQPLIVSRPGDRDGAPFQLIAGERRLLAARQAGLAKVPVIVKEASPQASFEMALVENLQRADLGALEEASAFKRLGEEFALTQEEIATRVGRSRSAVANSLRLLTLSDEIQASLARGEITSGHARALLGIDDPAERRQAWQRIVEGRLTVRDAEAMAKSGVTSRTPHPRRRSAELNALEEQLRGLLGTKVDLTRGRKGGKMVIYFYSDEELESLIEKLG